MKPGRTGAKRQSFHESNPRGVLDRLMEDHPTRSEEWLSQKWWEEVKKDSELLQAVADYWWANNYRSATKKPGTVHSMPSPSPTRAYVPPSPAERKKIEHDIVERKREIESQVERIEKNFSILSMLTPNGKPLYECTGNECIKLGGWYESVGRRVGRRKVGSVMTEDALQELIDKAAL